MSCYFFIFLSRLKELLWNDWEGVSENEQSLGVANLADDRVTRRHVYTRTPTGRTAERPTMRRFKKWPSITRPETPCHSACHRALPVKNNLVKSSGALKVKQNDLDAFSDTSLYPFFQFCKWALGSERSWASLIYLWPKNHYSLPPHCCTQFLFSQKYWILEECINKQLRIFSRGAIKICYEELNFEPLIPFATPVQW